jgi:hypothetical protein
MKKHDLGLLSGLNVTSPPESAVSIFLCGFLSFCECVQQNRKCLLVLVRFKLDSKAEGLNKQENSGIVDAVIFQMTRAHSPVEHPVHWMLGPWPKSHLEKQWLASQSTL